MKAIVAALSAAALVACATLPKDSAQTLYTAEAAFTEAVTLASQYSQLPVCNGSTPLCSDPAIVKKMIAAADTAQPLILKAQQTIAVGGSAEAQAVEDAVAAVAVLTALTSQVKVS